MSIFVHPQGLCESERVGEGTRVWAFAHVLPGAVIGCECNICDHVFIENDVLIGDRVTIKCGVQIWDGLTIEDDVFIGPNATFTNDLFPRSKVYPEQFSRTVIRQRASIGANATILAGISIGQSAMVGAGAVVTRSVPSNAIVAGNPARIIGYVDAGKVAAGASVPSPAPVEDVSCRVPGVRIIDLPAHADMRGRLNVAELEKLLPFGVKRYFVVHGVPSAEVRGEHAHRECHQFLNCIAGRCSLVVDDGRQRQELLLGSPSRGVYLPPMVWGIQYKFSPDAVLLVLASHGYDDKDYIRNYDEFLTLKGEEKRP